jgi:Zn-dependent metalloprotease
MTGVGATAKKQDERAVLTSLHDMGRGPIIAKFAQEFSGVEVFNRELNVLMDRDLNMVAASGYFANINQSHKSTPKLRLFSSQESAFSAALSDISNFVAYRA